jgi:hypothetical protein
LLVQDRRPGLEAADYRFDGIEAEIYLACDAGATAARIHDQLVAKGDNSIDTVEIEAYLRELVEAKLMYREADSFLSLAVAVSSFKEALPSEAREGGESPVEVMYV